MNTMKDKLTSSVRKAKTRTTQQPKSEDAVPAKQPAAKSTEVNPEVKQANVKRTKISAGGIPESSGELFPNRVWPD
ncbi:hypothetical protein [Nitrosomonas sp.]|uniref:hypothetical protein n=2 Tax=Nitrosomonas sp. TaxID=42353 RepID=UPI001D5057E2|nr:hypothetical protein [Nitrosomonas sp.]MCB1949042.1 hypothetical protein [Nitrosomonas sp.]MCP5244338.1 hypothetical protein [Burkholderiales bacterium]MDR4514508.1 hypothetical protein [Nitrosomonas sp.]